MRVPAGIGEIDVTFDVDATVVCSVSAVVRATGATRSVSLRTGRSAVSPTPGPRSLRCGECGRVVVGDDVEIGAGTTIDRGTYGPTRIGDGTKIDAYLTTPRSGGKNLPAIVESRVEAELERIARMAR